MEQAATQQKDELGYLTYELGMAERAMISWQVKGSFPAIMFAANYLREDVVNFTPEHRRIQEAVFELHDRNQRVNLVVLERALKQTPRPDGERDYLIMLGQKAPPVRNDDDLCRKLSDCHARWRKMQARREAMIAPSPLAQRAEGDGSPRSGETEGDFAHRKSPSGSLRSPPPAALRAGEEDDTPYKDEQPDRPMARLKFEERERAERQLAEMENRQPCPTSNIASLFEWEEPARIPQRVFMLQGHAAMGFVSGTVAPGGVGKTALVLAECLGLATGADIFEIGQKGRTNVWYIGLEDSLQEYRRRVAACALLHKLDTKAIGESFFLNVGTNNSNFVMTERTQAGTDICRPVMDALVRSIAGREIDLVVVDPFVASHRAAESDNMTIAAVVRAWSQIAERSGAAIELVHHTRKDAGTEPSADNVRGASAFVNALRSVRTLVPMNEAEAAASEVYFPDRYFRVVTVKANISRRERPSTWREIVAVPLGNNRDNPEAGDYVGAVRRWEPPSFVTDEQFAAIKEALKSGEFRLDIRAENWAGKPIADILGFDVGDASDRAKLRGALKGWLGTGALKVEERDDGHRKVRQHVVVRDVG